MYDYVFMSHMTRFIDHYEYYHNKTRTKTSTRYAKENDTEKERKKGRRRDIMCAHSKQSVDQINVRPL